MFGWWTDRRKQKRRGQALFDRAAAAARVPELYLDGGVADTTDGRFEMLCLHMVVLLDRVQRVPADGALLARAANEAFVETMDDTMRQMGVGDLAVPRKVKKAAAALYDRRSLLGPLLESARDETGARSALTDALVTLRPQPGLSGMDPAHVAAALVDFAAGLAAVTDDDLRRGPDG
jgi:cytochrome b pre-mRNA-processing protein 3